MEDIYIWRSGWSHPEIKRGCTGSCSASSCRRPHLHSHSEYHEISSWLQDFYWFFEMELPWKPQMLQSPSIPSVELQWSYHIKTDHVLIWARTNNSFVFFMLPSSMELHASWYFSRLKKYKYLVTSKVTLACYDVQLHVLFYQFLKKWQLVICIMGHIYKQRHTALWKYSTLVQIRKTGSLCPIWMNITNPYFQLIYSFSQ